MNVRLLLFALGMNAAAQTFEQRGFLETRMFGFPKTVPGDSGRLTGDALLRWEASYKLTPEFRISGAIDARTDSRNQTARDWTWNADDRTTLRPAFSLRRLSAIYRRKGLTVEAGRQMIRWGKTDLLTPTDRFAPRDFMNVVTNDFLGVTAARVTYERGANTWDAVWSPYFTPSRTPLLNQRWTVIPPEAAGFQLTDLGARYPGGSQFGGRFSHTGASGWEASGMFYEGFNHLPLIEGELQATRVGLRRYYPHLRLYGGDFAMPLRWFTVKAEAAHFTSRDRAFDQFVQYVVQVERLAGEWVLVGGYAGEVVTERRNVLDFAPDRGIAKTFLGRAAYTIDANRSIAWEGAIRQNGRGAYGKFEYSQAIGGHWRATAGVVLLGGRATDFLGQYRRNSHLLLTLRYSF